MPSFLLEDSFDGVVAGIDEAGRGPWAGPVVAGAVILNRKHVPQGLNDSKQLSPEKREFLFKLLKQYALIGVGIASVEEIDTLNILGATKLAMQRALEALPEQPDIALVDGNQPPVLPCKTESVIRGDSKSFSIAAASIVAKVTRDGIMRDLARVFPHYAWCSNMGYGTREHQEAISRHGITLHHRKSFAPIRDALIA